MSYRKQILCNAKVAEVIFCILRYTMYLKKSSDDFNMDVSKRKPEIQKLFDKAWGEVAEKNIQAAKATVDELEAKTPPIV